MSDIHSSELAFQLFFSIVVFINLGQWITKYGEYERVFCFIIIA